MKRLGVSAGIAGAVAASYAAAVVLTLWLLDKLTPGGVGVHGAQGVFAEGELVPWSLVLFQSSSIWLSVVAPVVFGPALVWHCVRRRRSSDRAHLEMYEEQLEYATVRGVVTGVSRGALRGSFAWVRWDDGRCPEGVCDVWLWGAPPLTQRSVLLLRHPVPRDAPGYRAHITNHTHYVPVDAVVAAVPAHVVKAVRRAQRRRARFDKKAARSASRLPLAAGMAIEE